MEYHLSLLAFTFVAGITPGPNNIMLMTSGVNHGIRNSLPHYFGICLGFPLMAIVIALGLSAVLIQYPQIHIYIKLIGSGYLMYLAWKIANADNPKANIKVRRPLSFFEAALFQWLNPKALVIAIGALVTFTRPESYVTDVVTVIFYYFVVGFICMGVWLWLGSSLQPLLNRPSRLKVFNISMGLLLLLSVLPIVMTEIFGFLSSIAFLF